MRLAARPGQAAGRPLALTVGDPAGIGLELALTIWARRAEWRPPLFILIAPAEWVGLAARRLGLDIPVADAASIIDSAPESAARVFATRLPVLPLPAPPGDPIPGVPDPVNAATIIASITEGVRLVAKGAVRALVTNPIAKKPLYEAGFRHPGHTEFLAECARNHAIWVNAAARPVMMLAGGDLRVALATIHVPLTDIVPRLRAPADPVADYAMIARIVLEGLRRDFGFADPRLVLAGVNPHAGEGGAIGREELEILNPAAESLRREGYRVADARSADTLFHAEARTGYDAVLAAYHDQGLIPVKMLDFRGGVNVTLGLPFVRTSPDHGTGFDIAGRGIAFADSLLAALRLADVNSDRRARFQATAS